MDRYQRKIRAAELNAAIMQMALRISASNFKAGCRLGENNVAAYERWDRASQRQLRALRRLTDALSDLAVA